MNIQQAIQTVMDDNDLTVEQMTAIMHAVMSGEATPVQIAGLLVALRVKGESVDELVAAAAVMRELSVKVEVPVENLVDTCGTGGDAKGTFNVSTAAAFVVAAAGGRVAKHGNRAVSGKSGSADLLEAAGVNLKLTPRQVAGAIDELGIGFLFAPAHHDAMRHAIGARRELGVRTLFNLLGPLTNPAAAPHQVMGVFNADWLAPLAQVVRTLGSRHVLVVHSRDGLDEIGIADATEVAELKGGEIHRYQVSPQQFGLQPGRLEDLMAEDVTQSLRLVDGVFDNRPGAPLDIVKLNAGAALYAGDKAATLSEGVQMAAAAVADGRAKQKFQQYVAYTNDLT